MSHRVAELIDRASCARTRAERDAAAEAAETLILRLWERRTAWPHGWPPPEAANALKRLSFVDDAPDSVDRIFQRPLVDDGAESWLDTIPLILDLQKSELETWIRAALLEIDVSELRGWVEDHGTQMDSSERNILEHLASAAERAGETFDLSVRYPSIRSEVPGGSRRGDPLGRLRAIQKRRSEILRRVAKKESTTAEA